MFSKCGRRVWAKGELDAELVNAVAVDYTAVHRLTNALAEKVGPGHGLVNGTGVDYLRPQPAKIRHSFCDGA